MPRRAEDYAPVPLEAALEQQRLAWTEDEFADAILSFARQLGWKGVHFRPGRTVHGWRTPFTGDAGFPDLVLARHGVTLHRELKRAKKPSPLTPEQEEWLGHLNGAVWTPRDWTLITDTLLAGAGLPVAQA